MKRSWLVLSVLLLVGATPYRIQNVLQKSLQNEREAVAKYEAFAAKAAEEGYPGAAALFRAAARAEGVHAERILAAMKTRNVEIPAASPVTPTVGSTADNLRAAATAETQERDGWYKEAIDDATEVNDQDLVKLFDQTRDTEVEHANLFVNATRHLEEYRQPKHFFVCDHCGYTTDVALPLCALCRSREHPHEID